MAGTVYISYYGNINEANTKTTMDTCANVIAQANPSDLYFLFSSTGGSVDAGMALYNFLRALPVPVVMHNTGSVNSMANVVFLAADTRYAAPHSMFLLHGITWTFAQGGHTWAQVQEAVSSFQADESRMSGIITSRTTITNDELTGLFHQGETKDLAFAQEKGLIQEVCGPKIEAGVDLITLRHQIPSFVRFPLLPFTFFAIFYLEAISCPYEFCLGWLPAYSLYSHYYCLQPVLNLIRVETDAGLLTSDAQLNMRNVAHTAPLINGGLLHSTPLGDILCLPKRFNVGCWLTHRNRFSSAASFDRMEVNPFSFRLEVGRYLPTFSAH